jgi:hypothetical protein
MLQHESTLQIARAVQPGRQPEMTFEQRPDPSKDVEDVFSSSSRHVGEYTFCNWRTSVAPGSSYNPSLAVLFQLNQSINGARY